MSVKITDRIPKEKMKEFHSILCSLGGRYLSNPFELSTHYQVYFEIDRYEEFCDAWNRLNLKIVETSKKQKFFHTIFNKLKGYFKS